MSITDTERLDFLLKFFNIEDVGDDQHVPGIVVNHDDLVSAIDGGLTQCNIWHHANLRQAIDVAIQKFYTQTETIQKQS